MNYEKLCGEKARKWRIIENFFLEDMAKINSKKTRKNGEKIKFQKLTLLRTRNVSEEKNYNILLNSTVTYV